jgi:hypothetical protein
MLAIAADSMRRNSRCGVTGYLYFDDDTFLQVIEGLTEDVDAIYASIRRDPRHGGVRTLIDEPIATRQFGGWAMGFYDGSERGGLLRKAFRPDIGRTADRADASALLRFMTDLSLGRSEVSQLAPGGDD